MTNFDFLLAEKDFNRFANIAITAEKLFPIDHEATVIKCRKAMEVAVKWMYSVDRDLRKPLWDDKLVTLISTDDFKQIIGNDLYKRIDFIRLLGNQAVHSDKSKISKDAAMLCLENLHVFMDFVAYCYATGEYVQTKFNPDIIGKEEAKPVPGKELEEAEIKLEALIKENESLRAALTAKREEQQQTYVPQPLDISEFKTRQVYIDVMLQRSGWVKGQNWLEEYEVNGMPNQSGKGFIDYALLSDDGKILAIIEAKRTCKDPAVGRQQAKLYADLVEKQQNLRPVIFLTNGFLTKINDNIYPERQVAEIYSKRDLERLFNLRTTKVSLTAPNINNNISGRYYQKQAITSVCESMEKNRRKMLLVMATGSGKTRTVIGLCDVLINRGWVRNILFLADRNALVTQAKRSFVNLLPNLSVTNLCEDKENYSAHCVFSTYNTMMNCIDYAKDEDGRLFTSGHFDLVICDEAHRSIYNKYKEIFNYFDAPLIGLTATPKDEIDKDTYKVFDLQTGLPTFSYDLKQAVKDNCLVDYKAVAIKLKFMEEGIVYDKLSEEEKAKYEETFSDEEGELPDSIDSSALNTWVFNEDTIRQVLATLMSRGYKVDYGNKIGKTIIFAKSHIHAEKILEIFNKEYPHLAGYANVIDNYTKYAQSAIDEFSDRNKLPQIAISVDMLDTGIDIPEIVNLVFFKKVRSKAKFWQMIGRGTRKCDGLFNGEDKKDFYIFDFCANFEFFGGGNSVETSLVLPIQGALFKIKFEMAYKLQEANYQTTALIEFRKKIVKEMADKVNELNRQSFIVRQHLKEVEFYSNPDNYNNITFENTLKVKEIAFLIEPEKDDANAIRFDALLYAIELTNLCGTRNTRYFSDLRKKAKALSGLANIPEIGQKLPLIDKIINTSFLESATFDDFEKIRNELRDLMKYIEKAPKYNYTTDFKDEILSVEEPTEPINISDFRDYHERAKYYLLEHKDNEVIKKLRTNVPLDSKDVEELEKILWSEVGTKDEYNKTQGETNLGEFVRSIVGLDMESAKEAFADFLDESKLDSDQIYFVNQIVEYIVENGMMKDLSVLQEAPFNTRGSIIDLFKDLTVWQKIKKIIDKVNANALVKVEN
ncbi:MAG: DEAD/DEAH box helicase family protein [Candidatus Riflebacteria bacterium]|nr:DEAD/DEAH box helicase family protein [Candidatus Riflebacteria bacterium]